MSLNYESIIKQMSLEEKALMMSGKNTWETVDFEKYGMSVYFTHPYTSCEKGTNECHNKRLRRFIPKGKPISSYTAEDICYFADCINGLPRKILGYRTPEELFEQELDKIYAA